MVPPKTKASEILGRMKRQDAEETQEADAGREAKEPAAADGTPAVPRE
jgi:hypothetical protein